MKKPEEKQEEQKYDYGMIGLGTMGRNLVFNMCDHGFTVAGFDKDQKQVDAFNTEGKGKNVKGYNSLKEFVDSLKSPRVVMLLVPAGPIVDAVVNELKPVLSKYDLVVDCGNSHYTDTNTRIDLLAKENIHFMGIGISGGEAGARNGPSIMPGGNEKIYERLAPMLSAIAAKDKDEPCVAWLGNGSAGHYVKMVHNGIEYGLMQLISEAYNLLKAYAGLTNDELHEAFVKLNQGPTRSYLMEITGEILLQKDDVTDKRLVDMILDTAHQKGTGAWTSQDAMTLGVPIPTIDAAVTARNLSALKQQRVEAAEKLSGPQSTYSGDKRELITLIEQSLYFSMIATYAQGMALLQRASAEYKYDLKLDLVAAIWRGGCIIRASVLEDIRNAYTQDPALPNLMVNGFIAQGLVNSQSGIRKILQLGIEAGISLPATSASLAYYDSYRSAWLPANLVQAQRDYFGAHTYERTDKEGTFHTHWN